MGASLRELGARVAGDQRVRFIAVGGVNTVVGYAIYAVLAQWVFARVPFGYLLALVISYAISITLAFILYRRFVFVVKGNVLVDFARFVSVYAVSILANIAALPILVEAVHLHPLVAQAIVLIVTTLISFFGHKHFSFRRKAVQNPEVDISAPLEGPSDGRPIDSSS
ncbi:GtrA family protein [Microbacterium sp.]|uniref:GtrA family protein n=1 Tax=Microbacterium sp. TaxID=51671 RepID=UPI003F9C1094